MHTVVVIALPRFDRDLDPRTSIAHRIDRPPWIRPSLPAGTAGLDSSYHPLRPPVGARIMLRTHATRKGARGDREPHQVAKRIPMRGELLVRYGRREPAPHLFPGHRAQPGDHGLPPPLWAGGGGAPDRRRVRAGRPSPDLLHSRMVHGAISAGHRAHCRARP